MIAVTLFAATSMSTSLTAGRPPNEMLSDRVVMVSAKTVLSFFLQSVSDRP
jgi:hypothetical protein